MTAHLIHADALRGLAQIPTGSVQCVCTSPPYWRMRDYGFRGQVGLEETPADYVARLVEIFREVRRVLRADGTLWLNLGDCYAGSGRGGYAGGKTRLQGSHEGQDQSRVARLANGRRDQSAELRSKFPVVPHSGDHHVGARAAGVIGRSWEAPPPGLKRKDLCMLPARVAIALQDDGWWLRSEVIWAKRNCIPESVTDRPTRAHESVFLLSKSAHYLYDSAAVAEPSTESASGNALRKYRKDHGGVAGSARGHQGLSVPWTGSTRQKRSVWFIATEPYRGAHYAVMPRQLAATCILAGSRVGDVVLDPFYGSGTVIAEAERLGRHGWGIDANPANAALARERLAAVGRGRARA